MIDSGAYTDYQKKLAPMSVSVFTAWLDRALDMCKGVKRVRYFTLDVVGDAKQTRWNYDELLRRGYEPVPIITRGCPEADAEHYLATSPTVAIGGIGIEANQGVIHRVIRRYPMRQQHWLGFAAIDFLRAYRPQSVDASDLTYAHRVRQLKFSDLRKGTPSHLYWRDPVTPAHQRYIRRLGFDPHILLETEKWRNKTTEEPTPGCTVGCLQAAIYRNYQAQLRERGILYYCVDTGSKYLFQLFRRQLGQRCLCIPSQKMVNRAIAEDF